MILYYPLFLITVLFAVGVLLSRDTVRSAMCLVGVMFCLAANFMMMRQEFLAFIQILVYAGAIMVLFLFVIMLLNLRERETMPWYLKNTRSWGGALGFLFFGIFAWGVQIFSLSGGNPKALANEKALQAANMPEVMALSTLMMTKYIVPFLLTSVLLLVAVIGAIVMARRHDEDGNEIVLDEEAA